MAASQPGAQGASARPAESLSRAVLGQYLSAGAELAPDRRLGIEPQPLLRLLTFYADAGKAGVLPAAALQLVDGEAAWDGFSQGQAPVAYVNARRFVAGGNVQEGYAAPPGQTGPAPSLVGGWTLAIVTPDPARQQAAAELIAWLLKPEHAGEWAKSANWLPTSSEALKLVGTGSYWDFVDTQLVQARSLPTGTDYVATAGRIQAAIQAVVRGENDPATAAEAAINGEQ
jgi:ABC-type glycerol-3-phosphate transport system substrate-binding protein